jgi:hypothetical protein
VQKGIPADVATAITSVTHGTFVTGMTASFLVAACVAVAGALVALATRKGSGPAS